MLLRKSVFKEYDRLLVPEDASLSMVMLAAYKDIKTQYVQNIIHFQKPKHANTWIFLQHSRCYQTEMPFTQKLLHRCSLSHTFSACLLSSMYGAEVTCKYRQFLTSDMLQRTCAIHFSMHLTYRKTYT